MDLHPYQQEAVNEITTTFSNGSRRVTLVMPCGTGKTEVASRIIPTDAGENTIIFVPTVALLLQTAERLKERHDDAKIVCVFSDKRASNVQDEDDASDETESEQAAALGLAGATNDHGFTGTTVPAEVAAALHGQHRRVIVISTYASADKVREAFLTARVEATLTVCDEAHRTVGWTDRTWSIPVAEDFPTRFWLFMTATPKYTKTRRNLETIGRDIETFLLPPESDDYYSMHQHAKYGQHIVPIKLDAAIEERYLSDYRIVMVAVSSQQYKDMLEAKVPKGYPVTAAVSYIAFAHVAADFPDHKSFMLFHNRKDHSRVWTAQFEELYRATAAGLPHADQPVHAFHIDGGSSVVERTTALDALRARDGMTVVSNCNVFSEGVDVPELDGVVFAGPRSSGVDIVQIVGRALRKNPDADKAALIIVPVVVVEDSLTPSEVQIANTSNYAAHQMISAMRERDELLHKTLLREQNKRKGEKSGEGKKRDEGGKGKKPGDKGERRTFDVGRLVLDASEFNSEFASNFWLEVTRHPHDTYANLAAHLENYAASAGGSINPEPDVVVGGDYKLGFKVRQLRLAYRDGKRSGDLLPTAITDMFEAFPGWTWKLGATFHPRRGFDEWKYLVALFVWKTNHRGPITRKYTPVIDPDTGGKANLGDWYATKYHKLLPSEKAEIDKILSGDLSDFLFNGVGPGAAHVQDWWRDSTDADQDDTEPDQDGPAAA